MLSRWKKLILSEMPNYDSVPKWKLLISQDVGMIYLKCFCNTTNPALENFGHWVRVIMMVGRLYVIFISPARRRKEERELYSPRSCSKRSYLGLEI
jgi:hypothetical protein